MEGRVKLKNQILEKYESPVLRFLLIGAVNFILTYSIYLVFLLFASYVVSYLVSFTVGILFISFFNIYFVFSYRVKVLNVILYGVYYCLYSYGNILFISYLVERQMINPKWAMLISLFFLTPLHFMVSRLLTRILGRV
jgi:hypothetical protein